LLMLQVGAEPDELTESVRGMLEEYRDRLQAGDVLRMLRLLAEDENNIRRTVNPRLAVETLLLRWAVLDRMVDLEEVLGKGGRGEAGKRGSGAELREEPAAGGVSAGSRRDTISQRGAETPGKDSTSPPFRVPASPPTARLAPSIEAIRAGWPAIIVAARVQSRFLGELLAAVEPAELVLPWLNVVMREPNQLFAERLTQEAGKVEEILTRTLGQPVRLRIMPAPSGDEPVPAKPRRLSDSSIKADRLREFRAKDPALDTAADALDFRQRASATDGLTTGDWRLTID